MKRLLFLAMFASAALARPRALLIGINDYSATQIRTRPQSAAPGRQWPDLAGTVNDVNALREILIGVYAFDPRDVVTLTDQSATRAAILQAIEQHLVANAAKGDVVFFYFAGHGSQVRNSKSDEPDGFDESIIPADSRLGAPDIRDKELRRLFNRILDRGARLTILLDNCFSGSGARGFPPGSPARGIDPDLRDIRDAADYGPRPERRGALVLSAAQDFDSARERTDAAGKIHGAFSLAWLRALRDAAPGRAGRGNVRARRRADET
ncbi:MAG TPA: caspase family protein [Thermoanaerobaculia bacterium]|nr:caspase family protein [Thermoanaerobaculia bacterium]